MSVLFILLIMFVFARFIIKCSSRKSFIITGTIIAIVATLTDIRYIISDPKHYFIYSFWQVALAYIIYLAYVFANTTSIRRNRDFNRKIRTKTKESFNTQKSNGVYLIITSIALLVIGITLLILMLTNVYEDVPYIAFIGSVIGFITLLITGIIYIKTTNEKFILFIKTDDENYTFYVDIKNKYKFRYMDYISDIYRYYIIEKLGVFKYSGDIKEIHYVWILRTENLNNYDISKLSMEKTNNYWYNEIVNGDYKFRNTKFNIEIENNKIKTIK